MKYLLTLALLSWSALHSLSQNLQSLDTVKANTSVDNLYTRSLYGDALANSFVIIVKKEVKLHKHITHSEHVYILEGEGEMTIGEKKVKVKKGDFIFIPKGTVHGLIVTSDIPVKVLSVQAPLFNGKDRVIIQ